MNEGEFEWDAAKAQSNLVKHGVSFAAARYVFDDVFALERYDPDSEPGEVRYVITGTVKDVVFDGGLYGARQSDTGYLSPKGNEA